MRYHSERNDLFSLSLSIYIIVLFSELFKFHFFAECTGAPENLTFFVKFRVQLPRQRSSKVCAQLRRGTDVSRPAAAPRSSSFSAAYGRDCTDDKNVCSISHVGFVGERTRRTYVRERIGKNKRMFASLVN